jgi:hypothetical protein
MNKDVFSYMIIIKKKETMSPTVGMAGHFSGVFALPLPYTHILDISSPITIL